MKKKGFTLVELLAVIAIIAILMVLVMPNILNMFNGGKEKTFGVQVGNIVKAAETQRQTDVLDGKNSKVYCSGLDSVCADSPELSINETDTKYLVTFDNNKVSGVAVEDSNYCYINSSDPSNINPSDFVSGGSIVCSMTSGCSCGDNVISLNSLIKADVVVDNVSAMKNKSGLSNGQIIETRGFYSANDGGAAFYKVTNESLTANDISVFSLKNKRIDNIERSTTEYLDI